MVSKKYSNRCVPGVYANESVASFILDNAAMPPEEAGGGPRPTVEAMKARLQRQFERRPDRYPLIFEAPKCLYFPTRTMPDVTKRYPFVVGESFWRLTAYIDSVPPRTDDRLPGKAPHVLLTGPPGCGKSYLMAATAGMLSFGPQRDKPLRSPYFNSDYRTVLIGDCLRWIESDEPLQHFRNEFMAAFHDCLVASPASAGVPSPEAPPAQPNAVDKGARYLHYLACLPPLTTVSQVVEMIYGCCVWLSINQPETLLVFFIDQAEELVGRPDCIPAQIIRAIIDIKVPLVVFSILAPSKAATEFPFARHCASHIALPYRATIIESVHIVQLYGDALDNKLSMELRIWKDFYLWTGCNVDQMARLLAWCTNAPESRTIDAHAEGEVHTLNVLIPLSTSVPVAAAMRLANSFSCRMTTRLQVFRIALRDAIHARCADALASLDGRQRNVLLIVLFATILRVPIDMSGEFRMSSILALGSAITDHLTFTSTQSFYHATDGIITIANVPAATSLAAHVALCSASMLAMVTPTWLALFESVVRAMMASKVLCAEAKRRMSRFYVHTKFLWDLPRGATCGGKEGAAAQGGGEQRNATVSDAQEQTKRPPPPMTTAKGKAVVKRWSFEGVSETGEHLRLSFSRPRVVLFAGETPATNVVLFPYTHHGASAQQPSTCTSFAEALLEVQSSEADATREPPREEGEGRRYDAAVFLPARTNYWFFDAFILDYAERKLYAITTSASVGAWLRDLQGRTSTARLLQAPPPPREEILMTPLILLDAWRDCLRLAAFPKVAVKCCIVKTADFMAAAGFDPAAALEEDGRQQPSRPPPGSGSDGDGGADRQIIEHIEELTSHLQGALTL